VRVIAFVRCLVRGRHEPRRQFGGGFRCADCGHAGEDLDDMGFYGGGYVAPERRPFVRPRAKARA
jgi:hypothetical protein